MIAYERAYTEGMGYEKVYVSVIVRVDTEGGITPLSVEWADGRTFEITRLFDVRNAVPAHVGGVLTVRYDCLIESARRTLYREEISGRWFAEVPTDGH